MVNDTLSFVVSNADLDFALDILAELLANLLYPVALAAFTDERERRSLMAPAMRDRRSRSSGPPMAVQQVREQLREDVEGEVEVCVGDDKGQRVVHRWNLTSAFAPYYPQALGMVELRPGRSSCRWSVGSPCRREHSGIGLLVGHIETSPRRRIPGCGERRSFG